MLLIYTSKITPRLKYVFKQICTRILKIPVSFTNVIEEFIAHDSLKMSYGVQPLGSEFFVKSNGLLLEQGLSDIELNVQAWEDTKCFFGSGEKSHIPFDIFSASFYLLSRYEEYLPHVKDSYGRFTKEESLAFKSGFLHQPVIDIWAYKFKAALEVQYPNYQFESRQYSIHPVIDVPVAYHYKNKGFLRTFGESLTDLFSLQFKFLYDRFSVLFGLKKDPYDNFKWIINRQKSTQTKFNVFFLIGEFTTYDKNNSLNKKQFVSLIKSIADYCHVGIKASYMALDSLDILKSEKRQMDAVTNSVTSSARSSFSKVNIPTTYRNYIDLEIHSDYSMGYPNTIGFRAGTCTPFLFYDLDYEIQTPLMIHPYQLMDFVLLKHASLLDKKETVIKAISEVQKVNGTFTFIFHNYAFSPNARWADFKSLFNLILDTSNDISS
ncbi:polysaccharide deacetylase family protein [Flavobacteriaceae bacterium]|nr:polysaccharide deacetylase family protein [Flavobacteriaceae bacterium]